MPLVAHRTLSTPAWLESTVDPMQAASIDKISPEGAPESLPHRLVQTTSPGAVAGFALTAALATLFVNAPIALVIAHALEQPGFVLDVTGRPVAALQLAAAFTAGLVVCTYALTRLIAVIGRRRTVTLDATRVHVVDQHFRRSRVWAQPLAAYTGLTHRVRATLSGSRHSLVLTHPDPAREITLYIGPRLDQASMLHWQQLLAQPELGAADKSTKARVPDAAASGDVSAVAA